MPVGAIPFPFGICRICKDRATGVHYGVATCEGCKGFFKRSITRGDKYKCFFGGECDLTPKNRNRCKSCRFKKCLEVGMSVEAVRMGRIPKVDKEKALEVFHRGGSDFNNLEVQVEMTGSGTYDFKINQTEENGKSQAGPSDENICLNRSLEQKNPSYKSDNSHFLPGMNQELNMSFPLDTKWNQSENFQKDSRVKGESSMPYQAEIDFNQSGNNCIASRTNENQEKSFHHDTGWNPTGNSQVIPEVNGSSKRMFQQQSNWNQSVNSHVPLSVKGKTNIVHQDTDLKPCIHSENGKYDRLFQEENLWKQPQNAHKMSPYQQPVWNQSASFPGINGVAVDKQMKLYDFQCKNEQVSANTGNLQAVQMNKVAFGRYPENIAESFVKMHPDSGQFKQKPNAQCPVKSSTYSCRSETFSFQELPSPENLSHQTLKEIAVSKYGVNRQTSCDNFGRNFSEFDQQKNPSVNSSLNRMHSLDSSINTSVSSRKTGSQFMEQTFETGTSNFYPDDSQARFPGQEWTLPRLKTVADTLKCPNNFTPDSMTFATSNVPEVNKSNQETLWPEFEKIQPFVENSAPTDDVTNNSVQNSLLNSMQEDTLNALAENSELFENCKETFDSCFKRDNKLIGPTYPNGSGDSNPVQESKNFDFRPRDYSGTSHTSTSELENQSHATDTSNRSPIASPTYTQSFEYVKFSSTGSVRSSEGSSGSQTSGYSPSVIKILLDHVIEFNEGQQLSQKLKSKFEQTKTNQSVIHGALRLVNEAMERAKRERSAREEKHFELDQLPENKVESMTRFLNDSQDNLNFSQAPLMKKKCVSITHLSDPSDSLEGESLSNVRNGNHRRRSPYNKTRRKSHSPRYKEFQDALSPSNQRNGQMREFKHADISSTKSVDTQPQGLGNPNVQTSSLSHSSQNSNQQDFHSQSNPDSRLNSCQSEGQLSSQSKDTLFGTSSSMPRKVLDFDDTVTSTNVYQENPDEIEKILNTINCMNLGMKILNRFKPENRERIRLYKQGLIHLRLMSDSDEDCCSIYEALMTGISSLNDRILGFCDSVPGFIDLGKEDKEKLVKRAYYDMWTLSYAEYFQNGKSYWILPSGEIYSTKAMRKILNDEMVDTIMKFADQFNPLGLTDLETAIFAALRLTITDGVVIEQKEKVDSLHTHLIDTLTFEMARNHPQNHNQLFASVFRLVPLIEEVNKIQSQIIANFSVNRFKKKTDTVEEKKS